MYAILYTSPDNVETVEKMSYPKALRFWVEWSNCLPEGASLDILHPNQV